MQAHSRPEVLGFVELRVGSLAVQVPLHAAQEGDATGESAPMGPNSSSSAPEASGSAPLAMFTLEGDQGVIVVRGEPSDTAVERAVQAAARIAERHYSRKLLN